MSPTIIKPLEVVEKLGDLSQIDISAEVKKVLTSMSQARNQSISMAVSTAETNTSSIVTPVSTPPPVSSDPRVSRQVRILQFMSNEIISVTERICF